MARPLSTDLRESVVAAVLAGESCRSAAARFWCFGLLCYQVEPSADGLCGARSDGWTSPVGSDGPLGLHFGQIAQTPHLMLHGLKGELAARGGEGVA